MCEITKISEKLGLTPKGTADRIKNLLEKFSLPTTITFSKEKILEGISSDKKNFGNKINLIILKEIGNGEIFKINSKDLEKYIV